MSAHTWLYKVVYLKSGMSTTDKQATKFQEQLSDLGLRGWELVTVTEGKQAFFKKPR